MSMKGNSVRFRLTQSKVKQLCEPGNVSQQMDFGATIFRYGVKPTNDGDNIYANFKDYMTALPLSEHLGKGWHTNEQVGFQNNQDEPFLFF